MSTPSTALLALRPRFAEAILGGRKTVELRRLRPRLGEGAQLLLYAGAPVQRVTGIATLGWLLSRGIDELWHAVGDESGVSRAEFSDYLAEARAPTALRLHDVRPIPPQPLGFRPPQSWQRLRPDHPGHAALLAHVTATPSCQGEILAGDSYPGRPTDAGQRWSPAD